MGEAFALADAFLGACQVVAQFIDKEVRPSLENAVAMDPSMLHVHGLFLRVIAWLRTVDKLRHPGDFQAAATAARTLFEVAVDLTLLDFDRKTQPLAKLLAWERSAKLKHAVSLLDYISRQPAKERPPEADAMEGFVLDERASIEADRARF
jgi:hypothetical protein